MIDELEIAYMSIYALYSVIMELDTKKSREGKSGPGNGCWNVTKEELIMEF